MEYTYMVLKGDEPVVAYHRKYELMGFLERLPDDVLATYALWRTRGRGKPIRIGSDGLPIDQAQTSQHDRPDQGTHASGTD
jgi:hypothetical protein